MRSKENYMKKITLIALAVMFTTVSTFAQEEETAQEESAATAETSEKKWTNNIGTQLSVPVTKYKVDGEKIDQWGISFDLMYMGVHRNGFTVKATSGGGSASTGNFSFEGDDDRQYGAFVRGDLGAGYSFVHNEKFTLSALAMFGIEGAIYETEKKSFAHDELGNVDKNYTVTLFGFTLGADITAAMYTREHFGYYATITARYIPLASMVSGVKYEANDFTRSDTYTTMGHGVFNVTPSFGVVWRW